MNRERNISDLVLPDRIQHPGERCRIMGILNVTPDSFSDGGEHLRVADAVAHARSMIADGADIIDIGGESTRPGAAELPPDEELRRVLPVIEALRRESDIPISIDTRHADVARAALDAGADLINDVSALRHDPRMAEVAAACGAPVVLMHMAGTPATMQDAPSYKNVTQDIYIFFEERIAFCHAAGMTELVLDPGIGFGKTVAHNLQLVRELADFGPLGCPLLVGTSRKSFLGALTGAEPPDRLPGTIASCLSAWRRGAGILRVHDVRAVRDALRVADAIEEGGAHAV
ncbi:MAG: dihydropteroate synthase [Bacteroidota bacterium]|jgi:dihydropteroate synthase|nr:dihydropteroate synthase [Bacteroidota bacterium]